MKGMWKKTLWLLFFAICALNVSAVETAEQILTRCAGKFMSAPSLTLDFTLSVGVNRSNCRLTVSRDKYRLSSPDLEVWYDGATQWAYSTSDKEVSITDPTEEELMESNPFAIVTNYKKSYTCRRLSGDKNEIELVAKSKMATVRKAVVTIDGRTWLPTKLIVTMANGRTFAATVTSAAEGKALPSTTFIYNKEKYPAKTIIDLR